MRDRVSFIFIYIYTFTVTILVNRKYGIRYIINTVNWFTILSCPQKNLYPIKTIMSMFIDDQFVYKNKKQKLPEF